MKNNIVRLLFTDRDVRILILVITQIDPCIVSRKKCIFIVFMSCHVNIEPHFFTGEMYVQIP